MYSCTHFLAGPGPWGICSASTFHLQTDQRGCTLYSCQQDHKIKPNEAFLPSDVDEIVQSCLQTHILYIHVNLTVSSPNFESDVTDALVLWYFLVWYCADRILNSKDIKHNGLSNWVMSFDGFKVLHPLIKYLVFFISRFSCARWRQSDNQILCCSCCNYM